MCDFADRMDTSEMNAARFGRSRGRWDWIGKNVGGGNGLKGLRCHKPRFCSAAAARSVRSLSRYSAPPDRRRSTKMFGVAFLSDGRAVKSRARSLTSAACAVKRDRRSPKRLTRLEPSMASQQQGERCAVKRITFLCYPFLY